MSPTELSRLQGPIDLADGRKRIEDAAVLLGLRCQPTLAAKKLAEV